MRTFGLFTRDRIIEKETTYATFGASEILSSCLRRNFLDCAVIAADCIGTVVTSNPRIVQGLGGRISELIKTSPIPEVIRRVEAAGGVVVDKKNAHIDQVEDVKIAIKKGYGRIGVALVSPEEARTCKILEKDRSVKILNVAVHTTDVRWSVEDILCFDLITLCASKNLRKSLKGLAKAQAGKINSYGSHLRAWERSSSQEI